jgi:hypothetical protein
MINNELGNYAKFVQNDYFKNFKKLSKPQVAVITAVALVALYVAPITALAVAALSLIGHSYYKFEQSERPVSDKIADKVESAGKKLAEGASKAVKKADGMFDKFIDFMEN